MVSRKRNKGRARRAGANATHANNDNGRPHDTNTTTLTQEDLISKLNELSVSPSCNHTTLQPTQTSLAFVKDYEDTLKYSIEYQSSLFCEGIDRDHPVIRQELLSRLLHERGVLESNTTKVDEVELITDQLVALGTQYLLAGQPKEAIDITLSIVSLETTGTFYFRSLYTDNPKTMGTIRDLISDQPREAVRYLLRRNSCQCLRSIYEQLKANGKKGVCSSTACEEAQRERKQLRLCSGEIQYISCINFLGCLQQNTNFLLVSHTYIGCNVAQYCSSECQKQHWKMHKVVCGKRYRLSTVRLMNTK